MFLHDPLADYPLEAIIRGVSYYLRARYQPEEYGNLRTLDYGCGTGAHAMWLAQKGLWVMGVDASIERLCLAEERAQRMLSDGQRDHVLWCSSMGEMTAAAFDIVIAAYGLSLVSPRSYVFSEMQRVLKSGGLFCAQVPSLDCASYACVAPGWAEDPEDPGTLVHETTPYAGTGQADQRVHHFSTIELRQLLRGFSSVDLLPMRFQLPREESARMGFEGPYWVGQWNIYAVK